MARSKLSVAPTEKRDSRSENSRLQNPRLERLLYSRDRVILQYCLQKVLSAVLEAKRRLHAVFQKNAIVERSAGLE